MKMIAATLSKKNPLVLGFSISLIGAFTLRIHQHYQLINFTGTRKLGINFIYYRNHFSPVLCINNS